jgi:hypothetical protein
MTLIEAAKQALEALQMGLVETFHARQENAITALRTAIEQADEQEAWKTSDTAYRPEGLPTRMACRHRPAALQVRLLWRFYEG